MMEHVPLDEYKAWEKRWWRARHEHAYRLRIEGLTLNKIGKRLGVTGSRVAMLLYLFESGQRHEANDECRPFMRSVRRREKKS